MGFQGWFQAWSQGSRAAKALDPWDRPGTGPNPSILFYSTQFFCCHPVLRPVVTLGVSPSFSKIFPKVKISILKRHPQGSPLVATTAGSSAAGVELPTDDCRQPAGITDENSFFFIFLWRETIFLGKNFFLTQKMTLSTQKMVLFSIYCSSALSSSSTSSTPCSSVYRSGSVIAV